MNRSDASLAAQVQLARRSLEEVLTDYPAYLARARQLQHAYGIDVMAVLFQFIANSNASILNVIKRVVEGMTINENQVSELHKLFCGIDGRNSSAVFLALGCTADGHAATKLVVLAGASWDNDEASHEEWAQYMAQLYANTEPEGATFIHTMWVMHMGMNIIPSINNSLTKRDLHAAVAFYRAQIYTARLAIGKVDWPIELADEVLKLLEILDDTSAEHIQVPGDSIIKEEMQHDGPDRTSGRSDDDGFDVTDWNEWFRADPGTD